MTMTESAYDDTLPLPAEVEREFRDNTGIGLSAAAWLGDHGIDPMPVGGAALIEYTFAWNPTAGRYDFRIYDAEHVGPKREPVLAVPILEDGKFIDLLLIGDDMSFETACCRASWLGGENITAQSVQLHAHPLDWLEDGCAGACHVALISRKALKELAGVETIRCSDIGTALEAWSWAFDADEDELARFQIDDSPAGVRSYIEDEVKWRALSRLRTEGLPVGADPKFTDPEFSSRVEEMRSKYVYASETEAH
jgi:hypothetical protein